ncbi:MAG: hypothetical protein KatS3mg024_1489 [Armatimonadota bacterium]|nr:MAG: hypothetical protein KatS3mg024_1489 [Armatimonadota bacterium]
MDDASTDRTPELIAEYVRRDPRIISVRNPQNMRLPASLNLGFRRSKGTYLTWTSDDNIMRPQMLSELVAFCEANPQYGFVCSDWTVMDEEGKTITQHKAGPQEGLIYWNNIGPCFLYRRWVYDKVGEYEDALFCAEDYDYFLRILAVTEMAFIQRDLYMYRVHSGSLSATCSQQARLAALEARRRAVHFLRAGGKKDLAARCALGVAEEAAEVYGRAELWKALRVAIICAPGLVLRSGIGRHVLAACFLGRGLRRKLHTTYLRVLKPDYWQNTRARQE